MKLNPGDVLEPGAGNGRSDLDHVFFTSHRYIASIYALNRSRESGVPHIYQVKPIGDVKKDTERWSYKAKSARVVREVDNGLHN